MRTGRARASAAGLILLCSAGLAACGGSSDGQAAAARPRIDSSVVKPATLRVGDPMPALAGKPVLSMSGAITRHNHGGALRWDLSTLDRLGLSGATVYDPWAKKKITVQGVWLADLLAASGAGAAAGVPLVALDDYKVDLTAAEIRAGGIMLATRTGAGKKIVVEDGGPTRIVFVGNVASGRNPDQWIWNLKSLTVT